jgi:hypothetical protein
MTVRVFQYDLPREYSPAELEMYRELTVFGAASYDEEKHAELFEYKASLNTDSLDEAFMILNRWNDSDLEKIEYIEKMCKSMSVGDILELEVDTVVTTYMVDRVGFTEIREPTINCFAQVA